MSAAGTPHRQSGTGRRYDGRASLRSRSVMLIRFVPLVNGCAARAIEGGGRGREYLYGALQAHARRYVHTRTIFCNPRLWNPSLNKCTDSAEINTLWFPGSCVPRTTTNMAGQPHTTVNRMKASVSNTTFAARSFKKHFIGNRYFDPKNNAR